MFGGSVPGGFHQDVLNANPEDEAGKRTLVEEIKSRAKGSISSRNFPEAIQLYSKAIELFSEDAILHANRSMCHLSMNNAAEALIDANRATVLDPTYAKGFYRKGMAQLKLNNASAAKETFLQGIALVPDDKDFRSQLDKLQAAGVVASAGSSSSSPAPSAPRTTQKQVTKNSQSAPTTPVDAPEQEEDDSLGGVVRGYKKTADGKVTTFFNNELDESTKALIGNIAPKKIEIDPVVATSAASGNSGSVWNAAGTFEEVIHTPWALARLKELVSSIQLTSLDAANPLPLDSIVTLTKTDVTGDASVTRNRGKVKYVCDFTATCEWSLTVMEHSQSPEVITGTIIMNDITGDKDYDFEISVNNSSRASADAQKIVAARIKGSGPGSLKDKFSRICDSFYEEFKKK